MALGPLHDAPRARLAWHRRALPRSRSRRVAALACSLALATALPVAGADTADYRVCLDVTGDVRALGSEDAFEWEPAADRLKALGPAAWPALLRALEREGPAVREQIVLVLASGTEADDAVREGLARVARKDPEVGVRAVAVPALRKLAGKSSYDVVVAALDDPSPEVRRKAILSCTDLCTGDAALARLVALAVGDQPLVNALQAQRTLWSLTAEGRNAEIVAKIRTDTLAGSSASDATTQPATARHTVLAALLLAEIGDDAQLDVVAQATQPGQDDAIRAHALHALGRLGGEDRVPVVAAAQQDRAVGVYAYDALRRMSDRGIASADEAAIGYTGPRPPKPLPRP